MNENIQNENSEVQLPPVKIAFILDGEVVDVLHTDERLASIFLSDPLVVDVTGPNGEMLADVGWTYNSDTHEFTRVDSDINSDVSITPNILGHYETLEQLQQENPVCQDNDVYIVEEPEVAMYRYDQQSGAWVLYQ